MARFRRLKVEETKKETAVRVLRLLLWCCIDGHVCFFWPSPLHPDLARPQNRHTFKAMSLIHELSQTTAQAQLETERLVDSLVAKEKDLLFGNQRINQALQVRFTQQCRMAAQNERNSCSMEVRLSDEIKNRDGAKDVTEQKLWTMLAEVGLHDGTVVEQPDPFSIDMYDFLVRATWPVADAASPKEASPERARGTSITCPICHEQRPAVVLMPCGHVVCRNCRRCRKFRQCPMCRGPVSSASNGLFMDWRPRPCCPAVGRRRSSGWKLQAWLLWPSFVIWGVRTQCISEVACSQLPSANSVNSERQMFCWFCVWILEFGVVLHMSLQTSKW